MALALAQLGSTARAQAILKSLLELEPANRETLGLLGRTYKDEWHADRENTKARDSALEWYQRAFAIDPPDYYPGINAAALALLSDDRQLASHLATKVLRICQNNLQAPHPEELYWLRASLADAKGRLAIAFLSRLGVDASVIGNHEYDFKEPEPSSAFRYNARHGAQLCEATRSELRITFVNVDGTRVDDVVLKK